jgi:hypothetical protein
MEWAQEPSSAAGTRKVPVCEQLYEILENHLLRLGHDAGLAFGRSSKTPYSYCGVREPSVRSSSTTSIARTRRRSRPPAPGGQPAQGRSGARQARFIADPSGFSRYEKAGSRPAYLLLYPASLRGTRLLERRGRDLNPRRTQRPETVFETAAFDRSATPPRATLARAFPPPR